MVASYGALALDRYAKGYSDGSVAIALVDAVAVLRSTGMKEARESRRSVLFDAKRTEDGLRAVKWASLSIWPLAEDACKRARINWRQAYREAWARQSESMKRRRTRRIVRGVA